MPKGGLKGLLVLAKPKGGEEDEGPPSEEGGGDEERYFGMAFDAAADGDREAFAKAMRMAVEACMKEY